MLASILPFSLVLLAQTPPASQPASGGLSGMMVPILLMMAVFYFLMFRPQSKERKKRAAMLSAVKKNDRVVTIGGIVGTVQTLKDDEITLKVDESNNTKITFTRSAIQRVLDSDTSALTNGTAKK